MAATARRAVVLVPNDMAPYSRGLRVARSLASAGFAVEIAAVAGPGLPEREEDAVAAVATGVVIRRFEPSGRWARRPGLRGRWTGRVARAIVLGHGLLARLVPRLRGVPPPTLASLMEIALWPYGDRGWWHTLRRELEPADLYHACGYRAVGIALELAEAARRAGRAGRVVYDAIDLALDSNPYAGLARPILAFYRRRERGWVARADAVITVNEAPADHLRDAWSLSERPIVLANQPPRQDVPERRPDLVRAATGLGPDQRVVLYMGRLGPGRGLDAAAEAVLRVERAALVLVGFGPWLERLRGRDREARFVGRHFTLPAVHPDETPAWAGSADVSLLTLPGSASLNQRLSTPNKLWESLAGGTPLVVSSDLVYVRRLTEEHRLGSVVAPDDPADIARGLREVLDRPATELAELRERCARLARERFNWETAVGPYLELVERLVARTGAS
jgi:glycosyltransferase involved in cell wall biosynthesis